jgi:2-haloacid dehalogenase
MNLRGDLGQLRPEVEALAAAHPDDAALIRAWADQWHLMFAPQIPGTAEIVVALKSKGVRLAALSNFSADMFARAREMYPVLTAFDLELVSGREKLIKPDPRFFALMESRSGCRGRQIFYIDDRPENIAVASGRGWLTHRFTDAPRLARALREAGFALDLPG